MRSFYEWPLWVQWTVAIVLFASAMAAMSELFNALDALWGIPAVMLFVPVFFFGTTPLMRLLGIYTYYSPLLLVFGASKNHYDLHNGTNFDYLIHMKWADRGIRANRKILAYYLEGLLNIIKELETGVLPASLTISGTSYFFSNRTAERLGFRLEKPSLFYRLNLIVAFVELFWMYSYAHGQWRIPKVFAAKKAVISGGDLVQRKDRIVAMHRYLCERLEREPRVP